jgi:hypothetical protein
MKRIAAVIAGLSLVASGPALAADEKSETKTEHKADRSGASTTTEHSSNVGGAKTDEKTEVERHKRAGGKTETKSHARRKAKPAGKLTSDKKESEEKTVRDAQGNVVEHEKNVK